MTCRNLRTRTAWKRDEDLAVEWVETSRILVATRKGKLCPLVVAMISTAFYSSSFFIFMILFFSKTATTNRNLPIEVFKIRNKPCHSLNQQTIEVGSVMLLDQT
jgi:hypothetical protein